MMTEQDKDIIRRIIKDELDDNLIIERIISLEKQLKYMHITLDTIRETISKDRIYNAKSE